MTERIGDQVCGVAQSHDAARRRARTRWLRRNSAVARIGGASPRPRALPLAPGPWAPALTHITPRAPDASRRCREERTGAASAEINLF